MPPSSRANIRSEAHNLNPSLRRLLAGALALLALCVQAQPAQPANMPPNQAAQPQKVLRYAFPVAETGFDPARIVDL